MRIEELVSWSKCPDNVESASDNNSLSSSGSSSSLSSVTTAGSEDRNSISPILYRAVDKGRVHIGLGYIGDGILPYCQASAHESFSLVTGSYKSRAVDLCKSVHIKPHLS